MTFRQWILSFESIPACIKQIVSRPDFPAEGHYLDMLVYIDRLDVDPKEFLTLLKLYLSENMVKLN